MSRKKIIYVWKSAYPWDVRVEKVCKSLSKDYEVLILARWDGEPKKAEQIDGITIKRVGFKEKPSKSIPLSLNRTWKKELEAVIKGYNPDLLIVREIMLGTLVGKMARKYNIPAIMDMAENYPALMKLWRKYNDSFLKRFAMRTLNIPKMVERNSVKLMSGIIVVCEEQIERLNKSYNYPKDKIAIVKNTPYLVENKFQANIAPSNKIKFLHHGWLTEEKRIDNFIKAFIICYKNNENYQFDIAGNGNCISEYKAIAKDVNNINFLGEYKYDELNDIIAETSIGILPYEINDFNEFTIHNKLFDYFALSKPVLVSKARPNARIVEKTNSGFVIDCESVDSIVDFLQKADFSNLEELGGNAKKAYVEQYNWENDEKTLLKFVKEKIENV